MHSLVFFIIFAPTTIYYLLKYTMKKITLLLMAVITAFMANAEPANPTPVTMTQSNGETIQIKLVGDEFYHFNTTIDGYTVINTKGCRDFSYNSVILFLHNAAGSYKNPMYRSCAPVGSSDRPP